MENPNPNASESEDTDLEDESYRSHPVEDPIIPLFDADIE